MLFLDYLMNQAYTYSHRSAAEKHFSFESCTGASVITQELRTNLMTILETHMDHHRDLNELREATYRALFNHPIAFK